MQLDPRGAGGLVRGLRYESRETGELVAGKGICLAVGAARQVLECEYIVVFGSM